MQRDRPASEIALAVTSTGSAACKERVSTPPSISIIIPTWNEAAWLPSLLKRVDALEHVAEVIVADNASDDGTAELAAARGCCVVGGGLPGKAKNAGARVSTGDLLLFVDADVGVSRHVMAALLGEFRHRERSLVHFRLVPASQRAFVRLCYRVVDLYARIGAKMGAHRGSAPLICVRRDVFFAVGGFDETVLAAEDVDLIRRVAHDLGGVAYIREAPLSISARRFEVESSTIYVLKCLLWALLRALGLRVSICPYTWTRYPDHVARVDAVILETT